MNKKIYNFYLNFQDVASGSENHKCPDVNYNYSRGCCADLAALFGSQQPSPDPRTPSLSVLHHFVAGVGIVAACNSASLFFYDSLVSKT